MIHTRFWYIFLTHCFVMCFRMSAFGICLVISRMSCSTYVVNCLLTWFTNYSAGSFINAQCAARPHIRNHWKSNHFYVRNTGAAWPLSIHRPAAELHKSHTPHSNWRRVPHAISRPQPHRPGNRGAQPPKPTPKFDNLPPVARLPAEQGQLRNCLLQEAGNRRGHQNIPRRDTSPQDPVQELPDDTEVSE